MSSLRSLMLVGLCAGCASGQVDVGKVDQQNSPRSADLKIPESDEGVEKVGLLATVAGKVEKEQKVKYYVLVSPLSNPATRGLWWVQRPARRSGAALECRCQFGEGPQEGRGEFFAIVVIATDKAYGAGQQLKGIPKSARYSKLKIVKRTR